MSEIVWNRQPNNEKTGSPHRDYENNLRMATDFCNRIRPRLPKGMKVEISGQNILMFSWNPGRYAPKGNYATPVSLHQSRSDLLNEARMTYNTFIEMVRKFHERFPVRDEDLFTLPPGKGPGRQLRPQEPHMPDLFA